jgi:hypothetical protein
VTRDLIRSLGRHRGSVDGAVGCHVSTPYRHRVEAAQPLGSLDRFHLSMMSFHRVSSHPGNP